MQVGLVLLVCIGVYWVRLGGDGFLSSEGHRVIPALGMVDSGDYLVPRLFGRIYYRKPPGVYWALAGSMEALGRTEFGARAVSAASMTAGALLSLAFARRWFGRLDPAAGLVAGLAHALTPWFWQIGRVAEIEALHQLAVQASVFLLIDAALMRPARAWAAAGAGMAIAAMGLVKGPAGAPVLVGALGGVCIGSGSIRTLLAPQVRAAALIAGVILAGVFALIVGAVARTGGEPVAQSVGEFLWNPRQVRATVLLLPTALGSALPLAFALLYPWGRGMGADWPVENRLARALGWACVISLGIFLALGVHNRRYVLPAFSFLGPLAAFAAARIAAGTIIGVPGPMAKVLLIDRREIWFVGMIVAAGVWLGIVEPRRAAHSGREAGLALARTIEAHPGGSELWADHLIEARPEVLWYAQRELERRGTRLDVRWVSGEPGPMFPPSGEYLALRSDDQTDELSRYGRAGLFERAERIGDGEVHQFAFEVFQVR